MSKMIDALILNSAVESMRLYGTPIPPPAGEKLPRRRSKKPVDVVAVKQALHLASLKQYGEPLPPYWRMLPTMKRYCTYCDGEFPVVAHFGLKRDAKHGQVHQPTCRKFRASREAHPGRFGLPRKKRTTRPLDKP